MAGKKNPDERWLWFASRTSLSVPLDPGADPSTIVGGRPTPFPDWACQSPNGGVHIDNRRGRIDVDAAESPNARVEFNWTKPYGVRVISRKWFADIEDVVDQRTVFVGDVRRKGRSLEEWVTVHQLHQPPILSSEGWAQSCPICDNTLSVLRGVCSLPIRKSSGAR
jgi:hypothetical protein